MEKVVMTEKEKDRKKYLDGLVIHRANVIKCFKLIEDQLTPETRADVHRNIIVHDMSKYDMKEFLPYVDYFSGKPRTPKVEKAFEGAWFLHKMNNPHHWEYWLDNPDNETSQANEMPLKYIIEMVCDWGSFSLKAGNYKELSKWYNSQTLNLAPRTAKSVRYFVAMLSDALKEYLRES